MPASTDISFAMSPAEAPRMLNKHSPSVTLYYLAAAYFCVHALWATFITGNISYVAYLFQILSPALACAPCLWRARGSSAQARFHWLLLGSAMLGWTIAVIVAGCETYLLHSDPATALTSDLIYFLYGVPILLAISSPTESPHSTVLFTLD